MEREEQETKIIFAFNSLADKDILAEKQEVVTKKEYLQLITDADIKLEIFKKDNPNIYVEYFFSPKEKGFSIYNLHDLDRKEQMICDIFLDQLNELAHHHLKDK